MVRALRFLVAVSLLVAAVVVAPTARAQAQQADESYADHELQLALGRADLVDEWIETSGVSTAAALVEVVGDGDYDSDRQVLLTALAALGEQREHIDDRKLHAETLIADLDRLEALTRDLRREASESGRNAAVSLTPRTVADARLALDDIAGDRRWRGVSLDVLTLAEHHLVEARDTIARRLDTLSSGQPSSNKALDGTVTTFTAVLVDLERVRALVERTAQRALTSEFKFIASRNAVAETMPALHEIRLLSPTVVGGLTLVTFDAYVKGAQALDPACPVDWALLAGIGRVESRHGTIDDTVVYASGQVSTPILGPLLDGGATERDAQNAAEAAAAALEAEEALRQAEIDAELEAEAAAQAALAALVWGEEGAAERAEELEERTAPADPVGLAATPEPVVEEPAPRYDPLLWGDDLPFDEDDLPPLDDEDIIEPEEEPEFKGNGFAVIADSDNGRLDGNARWDRAVGPMQFIPETWSYWETDGNGDGTIDPQNLYDAAATAGQFLCHLSRARGSSPSSFVLGYNSSQTYVRNVLAVADAFDAYELPKVMSG